MKFRPCIDIHNGKVKQIVGGSLKDEMNQAIDNFVSEQDAAWYARLYESVGREHLVLDLSCRKKDGLYYIVTDRWQKFTEHAVNEETLNLLAPYCSEFLIHAVDVEGKASGIEEELASMLGVWDGIPITYAGGVGSLDDVELLKRLGNHRLDVAIGSALDIFGGTIPFEKAADIS